jgi:glycerol-3-phosphate O-acyltransferase/dihydroxyacetone phosphate acyltransferase
MLIFISQASTVKIRGRDVIASYKVLIGFVLVPIFYTFYAGLTLYYSRSLRLALLVLLVLPFFSYATYVVFDE